MTIQRPIPIQVDCLIHTDKHPFCKDKTCPCHTYGYPIGNGWRVTNEGNKIVSIAAPRKTSRKHR